jgi:hypothetical protein
MVMKAKIFVSNKNKLLAIQVIIINNLLVVVKFFYGEDLKKVFFRVIINKKYLRALHHSNPKICSTREQFNSTMLLEHLLEVIEVDLMMGYAW